MVTASREKAVERPDGTVPRDTGGRMSAGGVWLKGFGAAEAKENMCGRNTAKSGRASGARRRGGELWGAAARS